MSSKDAEKVKEKKKKFVFGFCSSSSFLGFGKSQKGNFSCSSFRHCRRRVQHFSRRYKNVVVGFVSLNWFF